MLKKNLTRDWRGTRSVLRSNEAEAGTPESPLRKKFASKKEKKCTFISVFDFFLRYKFNGYE